MANQCQNHCIDIDSTLIRRVISRSHNVNFLKIKFFIKQPFLFIRILFALTVHIFIWYLNHSNLLCKSKCVVFFIYVRLNFLLKNNTYFKKYTYVKIHFYMQYNVLYLHRNFNYIYKDIYYIYYTLGFTT